jgi:hypothetical protein
LVLIRLTSALTPCSNITAGGLQPCCVTAWELNIVATSFIISSDHSGQQHHLAVTISVSGLRAVIFALQSSCNAANPHRLS